MDNGPNDVIVRVTKDAQGKTKFEVLIALNNEALLPEMEKVAEFVNGALLVLQKTDAEVQYAQPIAFADSMNAANEKIWVPGDEGNGNH